MDPGVPDMSLEAGTPPKSFSLLVAPLHSHSTLALRIFYDLLNEALFYLDSVPSFSFFF